MKAGIMRRKPLNSKCINGNDSLFKLVMPINGVAMFLLRIDSVLFSIDKPKHIKGFIN